MRTNTRPASTQIIPDPNQFPTQTAGITSPSQEAIDKLLSDEVKRLVTQATANVQHIFLNQVAGVMMGPTAPSYGDAVRTVLFSGTCPRLPRIEYAIPGQIDTAYVVLGAGAIYVPADYRGPLPAAANMGESA